MALNKRRHSIGQPNVFKVAARPSSTAKNLSIALKPGQVRCEDCNKPSTLRKDGTIINHRIGGRKYGYLCLGGGTTRYTEV